MAKPTRPTDAELDILSVLWIHGPCTVRQVLDKISDTPVRGYTTVLKLLQIMSDKGLVRRDERQRAHVYEAAVKAEQIQGNMLQHLLEKAFDNSTSKLIMKAISDRSTSREELAEIRRLLDKFEKESK